MKDGNVPMLYPHIFTVLWRLALAETDTNYHEGVEPNTVREIDPYRPVERRRAGTALRSLERMGFVERVGKRGKLTLWRTTAKGYDTVYRFELVP
jgi:hypothetical protein